MKKFLFAFILITACTNEKKSDQVRKLSGEDNKVALTRKDSMQIRKFVELAFKAPLHSKEHQVFLDSALHIQPDNAWLWQQKAMPLYKSRKYSLGKPFLEKAVEYDAKRWLDYSGFMKCIFSKEYLESITDFVRFKNEFGDGYVMDHTYNFYIGLSYLQLNEFNKAKEFLELSKEQQYADFSKDAPHEACHYLDWYYLGIANFELGSYQEAISSFDMALKGYGNFADALYFKGRSLTKLGDPEGVEWERKAFENANNTINEDNVIYEIYPYQVFHKLNESVRPK
ncbi:tetratricopeptide repeat protein [Maribacter confluentis]|uniref:Tetratricopeptide repeat protein n=1 Tax=Maribacter confluentis TaxID=1656093 RepID=A0ABT8RMK4_9FLAO|nr:tetratricopeptide repeat protein [Maribacter confluentis]MDO1512150.1 tetratricopeptide repeat protein [Maribacter confluentis]